MLECPQAWAFVSCHSERVREGRGRASAHVEIDGFRRVVPEEGGAKPNRGRKPGEFRDERIRLFHHYAVCISAPAAKEECNSPEHPPVATLVVRVGLVADGLVRARRPKKCSFPPPYRQERRDVANVMHARGV
eukprot:904946-Pleurochrysis_carterae.AAC.1